MPPELDWRGQIWHVLPRGMRYERASATSIDLFVSEIVGCSRFPATVFAEFNGEPLPAPGLVPLPPAAAGATARRVRLLAGRAASGGAGLIVVQQHLPTAAGLARRVAAPVILQKHNFVRPPRPGWAASLSRLRTRRRLGALSGMTFVSEAVQRDFERDWPAVACPRRVIPNGLDLTRWRPRPVRDPSVLVVGRATPEKGLLEAAQALAGVLPDWPDWTATFVVSEAARDPAYFGRIRAALAPLGPRAVVRQDAPADEVRALNERAAIALIPSKWREPFGRTCLEAHAGGAAVISSGTGGLREISGGSALYLPAVTPAEIAIALRALLPDASLRGRLAGEGRARVGALFELRAVAAAFDDFCAQVASGG